VKARIIFLAMSLWVFTACVSAQPTPYVAKGGDGYGYSFKELNGIQIANFTGNKDTPIMHAYAFSILAAIDECAKKNKFAVVSKAVNQTKEVNYTQVYSETFYDPTPRGMVPTTYINSHPKTDVYPSFAEAFECRSSLHQLEGTPRTENISKDLVSQFTKDSKGAVLLAFERGGFPVGVQDDDLVIFIDGKRVSIGAEFYAAIDSAKIGLVDFKVIRNNEIRKVKSKIIDATAELRSVERQTIDLMCNSMGIEVDELANIPAAAKAQPAHNEKNMSAQEAIEFRSGKELCARLRALDLIKAKK
jgi:hypothetical protein